MNWIPFIVVCIGAMASTISLSLRIVEFIRRRRWIASIDRGDNPGPFDRTCSYLEPRTHE